MVFDSLICLSALATALLASALTLIFRIAYYTKIWTFIFIINCIIFLIIIWSNQATKGSLSTVLAKKVLHDLASLHWPIEKRRNWETPHTAKEWGTFYDHPWTKNESHHQQINRSNKQIGRWNEAICWFGVWFQQAGLPGWTRREYDWSPPKSCRNQAHPSEQGESHNRKVQAKHVKQICKRGMTRRRLSLTQTKCARR